MPINERGNSCCCPRQRSSKQVVRVCVHTIISRATLQLLRHARTHWAPVSPIWDAPFNMDERYLVQSRLVCIQQFGYVRALHPIQYGATLLFCPRRFQWRTWCSFISTRVRASYHEISAKCRQRECCFTRCACTSTSNGSR